MLNTRRAPKTCAMRNLPVPHPFPVTVAFQGHDTIPPHSLGTLRLILHTFICVYIINYDNITFMYYRCTYIIPYVYVTVSYTFLQAFRMIIIITIIIVIIVYWKGGHRVHLYK